MDIKHWIYGDPYILMEPQNLLMEPHKSLMEIHKTCLIMKIHTSFMDLHISIMHHRDYWIMNLHNLISEIYNWSWTSIVMGFSPCFQPRHIFSYLWRRPLPAPYTRTLWNCTTFKDICVVSVYTKVNHCIWNNHIWIMFIMLRFLSEKVQLTPRGQVTPFGDIHMRTVVSYWIPFFLQLWPEWYMKRIGYCTLHPFLTWPYDTPIPVIFQHQKYTSTNISYR